MRTTDTPEAFPGLGAPIRPEPKAPAPTPQGKFIKSPDGALSTNLPPPPPEPVENVWMRRKDLIPRDPRAGAAQMADNTPTRRLAEPREPGDDIRPTDFGIPQENSQAAWHFAWAVFYAELPDALNRHLRPQLIVDTSMLGKAENFADLKPGPMMAYRDCEQRPNPTIHQRSAPTGSGHTTGEWVSTVAEQRAKQAQDAAQMLHDGFKLWWT